MEHHLYTPMTLSLSVVSLRIINVSVWLIAVCPHTHRAHATECVPNLITRVGILFGCVLLSYAWYNTFSEY